jgi:hypothetical protein
MSPLHRRPIRSSSNRRRTAWARSIGQFVIASATDWQTIALTANYVTAGGNTQGVTLARTHLRFAVASAVAPGDELAVAMIKGQNVDVGHSLAGSPEPIANSLEDWFYWSVFFASSQPGAGATFFPMGANNFYIDNRAKRKITQIGETPNLVMRAPIAGAYPVTVNYSASLLLMLP